MKFGQDEQNTAAQLFDTADRQAHEVFHIRRVFVESLDLRRNGEIRGRIRSIGR